MKACLILVILFSIQIALGSCEHTGDRFNCVKFVKNYDGDTMTFNLPGIHPFFGKKAKVRLQGIDTPELKPKGAALPCETEWGRVAKNLVSAELKNAKRIDITNLDGHDKYGRILGQVIYDGKNLKEVLLRNYLAVPYEGKKKSKTNWCELKARREKK